MSVQAISWALKHSKATLGDRLVLLVLADHAGQHEGYGDGHVCWPGKQRIAREARLSPRHVQRCIQNLLDLGEIQKLGTSPIGTVIYEIGGRQIVLGETSATGGGETWVSPEPLVRQEPKQVRSKDQTLLAPRSTKIRKKDVLWDTLTAELGEPATKSERGRRNKALKELRDIGATPEDIRSRLRNYRRRWPGVEVTATALAANWTTLNGNGNGHVTLPLGERMRRLAAERETT